MTVTEHLPRTLTIEADDPGEAIEKAEDMINSSEVVLDADDFLDRDFDCELVRFPTLSNAEGYYILTTELPTSTLAKLEEELANYLENESANYGKDIIDKSPVVRWYTGFMPASELIEFYRNEG